jgi:predicted TPR repeat methyltransferase
MRLMLAALAGSVLLLTVPLPQSLETPLRGLWVLLLTGIVAWQVFKVAMVQRHLLAAWLGLPMRRAPASYVRSLFDEYAERYDQHLLRDLDYAAPNLVRSAVGDRLDGRTDTQVVDLGCGTGLCGPLFRRVSGRLTGVDLSPAMLRQARRCETYDQLVEEDVVGFLARHHRAFDLLIAADVMVYIGDLAPLLRAAAQAMRAGGMMAVTLEADDGDSYRLQGSGRFTHSEAYLARVADQTGWRVVSSRRAAVRREAGQPVDAIVALLGLSLHRAARNRRREPRPMLSATE